MRYLDLINILSQNYPIQSNSVNNITLNKVEVLKKETKNFSKNTIYLCNIRELENTPKIPILVLSTTPLNSLPKKSILASIEESDYCKILEETKSLFIEEKKIKASLYELIERALEGDSIISLINYASDLVGNALILGSSNNKVLAYSTNYDIMDPLWLKNIENGYYTPSFNEKLKNNSQMREWNKRSGSSKIISLEGDIQPKLVSKITKNNHLLGGIVMIAHHNEITRKHMLQLPLIGKILFDSINIDTSMMTDTSVYSHILYNLLDEINDTETLEIARMSKTAFPDEMVVVVARFVKNLENRYLKKNLQLELEGIFPRGHSVIYKGYIGILVSKLSNSNQEELAELAENENITIGVSWPFNNIMEFKKYFNQSVITIKLSEIFMEDKKVLNYDNYSYYDLLKNYNGKIPLKYFVHPALKILQEYDLENNSDLYKTLYVYLKYSKKQTAAAEALYIHKNSLSYRINRIEELTNLDLDDNDVFYSLIHSFTINQYLISIDEKEKDKK
jgi:hypothetical protein